MDEAEVIQVIRTTIARRGDGSEENPNRVIEQFWSLDGKLLAENDIWEQQRNGYQRGTSTYEASDA